MRLMIFLLFIVSGANAQSKMMVNSSDFNSAKGSWNGTLTYLDYTSGKPFSMPANAELTVASGGQVILSLNYPKEPKANGNDTIEISNDGMRIDGALVKSKSTGENSDLIIVTEKDGVDGNENRKAVIRHTYIIGANNLQLRKDVKFDGTDQWIKRNEYLFIR